MLLITASEAKKRMKPFNFDFDTIKIQKMIDKAIEDNLYGIIYTLNEEECKPHYIDFLIKELKSYGYSVIKEDEPCYEIVPYTININIYINWDNND